jgi:hypothetical protein
MHSYGFYESFQPNFNYRATFFLSPQFYLQTVLLHLANKSESKGRLVEECPVALLCGEWVYGNRVRQQGVDTNAYRLQLQLSLQWYAKIW